VAWCFEDEATPELDRLLEQVQRDGALVPRIWAAEVANVLLMACRRNRIDRQAMQERQALLDMLPIAFDEIGAGPIWRSSVLSLAEMGQLTFYDAIYLELAIRRGLPLASMDRALRRAAQGHGVTVVPDGVA